MVYPFITYPWWQVGMWQLARYRLFCRKKGHPKGCQKDTPRNPKKSPAAKGCRFDTHFKKGCHFFLKKIPFLFRAKEDIKLQCFCFVVIRDLSKFWKSRRRILAFLYLKKFVFIWIQEDIIYRHINEKIIRLCFWFDRKSKNQRVDHVMFMMKWSYDMLLFMVWVGR